MLFKKDLYIKFSWAYKIKFNIKRFIWQPCLSILLWDFIPDDKKQEFIKEMIPRYMLDSLGWFLFNTMKDEWRKIEAFFPPPIKKISIFIDKIRGRVSGHLDLPCHLNLNFVVKAKSKSKRVKACCLCCHFSFHSWYLHVNSHGLRLRLATPGCS